MALDSRIYRGLSYDARASESSASMPSLRALEPVAATPTLSPMPEQDSANVKVVVRVRAFLKRERDRQARCIIRMNPQTQETVLQTPDDAQSASARGNTKRHLEERSFIFDRSFWSHDESDRHYAHQEDVYRSFGEEFLDHNFDGYHTCIFAYGQTGSGKSYTMMGTPEQPGLIPRTCENLFQRIHDEPSPNTNYAVHVSYFEVYNEHVRDLLVPRTNPPTYLKIRESQTDGVYVQGLTDASVKSYEDVERLMKMGDHNRTTAATKMNDTSSRSHAVFTILLKQIQHSLSSDETIERVARMRLVDLAGSERAKATEATGQRLAEGGKINKSLTTLGRVIAALADQQASAARNSQPNPRRKRAGEVVPYRDSVLTWLLKDSLGGNSKTAMVACISPTDYDETLSTLRYADQAKRIRTRATVNQDHLSAAERDAQISVMAATIEQLQRSLIASASTQAARKREEATELEDYQKQVAKMQRLMEETRMVSESRIRALTAEVEELRPVNERLRDEIGSLRRHLGLVVGELRNPIVLPPKDPDDMGVPSPELSPGVGEEGMALRHDADGEGKENEGVDWHSQHPEHEDLAKEMQAHAEDLLKELGIFRQKHKDDKERFRAREQRDPLSEVRIN